MQTQVSTGWVYNHHNGQSKQLISDCSCFTFQPAADSVFNNRHSRSGKLIKLTMLRAR